MAKTQVWELTEDGRRHTVTASDAGLSRRIEWQIDGELVAKKKTSDEKVRLTHGQHALDIRFTLLGRGKRATLHTAEASESATVRAELGVGGVDLVPAPGSPAAKREQWIRDHPRLHTLCATLGGTAGIVVPLVIAWLLARFAFSLDLPSLPLPDRPDLPSIPWPDIPWPDIPWPDISLPDWSMPGWVQQVLDLLKFVFPVVLAFAIARAEIRRRRKQDELRGDGEPEG
jgi:hypothetical protein